MTEPTEEQVQRALAWANGVPGMVKEDAVLILAQALRRERNRADDLDRCLKGMRMSLNLREDMELRQFNYIVCTMWEDFKKAEIRVKELEREIYDLHSGARPDIEGAVHNYAEQVRDLEALVAKKDAALAPFAEWDGDFPSSSGEELYVYNGKSRHVFSRSACNIARQALSLTQKKNR